MSQSPQASGSWPSTPWVRQQWSWAGSDRTTSLSESTCCRPSSSTRSRWPQSGPPTTRSQPPPQSSPPWYRSHTIPLVHIRAEHYVQISVQTSVSPRFLREWQTCCRRGIIISVFPWWRGASRRSAAATARLRASLQVATHLRSHGKTNFYISAQSIIGVDQSPNENVSSSWGSSHLLGGLFSRCSVCALDVRRALHRPVTLQDAALAGGRCREERTREELLCGRKWCRSASFICSVLSSSTVAVRMGKPLKSIMIQKLLLSL